MITKVFLIFALALVAIGGLRGFFRGAIKEGVYIGIWLVVFAVCCIFVSDVTDKIFVAVGGLIGYSGSSPEQIVSALLSGDTYLNTIVISLVRSVLFPVVAVVFFWIAYFVGGIIYAIVSITVFKKDKKKKKDNGESKVEDKIEINKAENKEDIGNNADIGNKADIENKKETGNKKNDRNIGLQVAGAVIGVVFSLFVGAFTLSPVAGLSSTLSNCTLPSELVEGFEDKIDMVAGCYEKTAVQAVYKYTGMEAAAGGLYNVLVSKAVADVKYDYRKALPSLASVGIEAYDTIGHLYKMDDMSGIHSQLSKTVEDFFALEILDDKEKINLISQAKSGIKGDMEWLLGLVEVNEKKQVINDIDIYGKLLEMLNDKGLMAVISGRGDVPELKVSDGMEILTTLYGLSNADRVVPEMLNYLYAGVTRQKDAQIVIADGMVLNGNTKADIEEVVSVICKVSSLLTQEEPVTNIQLIQISGDLKGLEDNELVGKKNYDDFADFIKSSYKK